MDNYPKGISDKERGNIDKLFYATRNKIKIIRAPIDYKDLEVILKKDPHSRYLDEKLEYNFRLSDQKLKKEADYKESKYYYETKYTQY